MQYIVMNNIKGGKVVDSGGYGCLFIPPLTCKGKNTKKKKKNNNLSGFAIPTKISNKLATFLNIDENIKISRTHVTSLICKYIKENNLQNPENKKIIIPDERLKLLFEGYLTDSDQLEFFNIQSYLKYHYY